MVLFRYWAPENAPTRGRFYVEGGGGEFICLQRSKLVIEKATTARREEILCCLRDQGIDLGAIGGMQALGEQLDRCQLLVSGGRATRASSDGEGQYRFLDLSPEDLCRASQALDVASVPCHPATIKETVIAVDHREPAALFDALERSPFRVERASLPAGDVLVSSARDDRKLLIERKTVTDLYNGITGDGRHCHEQAERYWLLAQEQALQGGLLRVVWLIEAEQEGRRQLYNALPKIAQMDGWVNYLVAILGQSVVTTFSTNHSAYLIAKMTQGFCEQSLFYPVKVGAQRIDMGRRDRERLTGRAAATDHEPTDHGVIQGSHSLASLLALFPGVSTRVARGLAATGLSLAEITDLEEDALLKIDGVGATTASHLRHLFNSLRGGAKQPARAKESGAKTIASKRGAKH